MGNATVVGRGGLDESWREPQDEYRERTHVPTAIRIDSTRETLGHDVSVRCSTVGIIEGSVKNVLGSRIPPPILGDAS